MTTTPVPPDDADADEPNDDILELDVPEHRHRTFGRLSLLFLGAAVGLFLTSLLLSSTLGGTLLDVVVIALLFGCVTLAVSGLGLLAAAGFETLKRRRTPDLLDEGEPSDP